MNHSQGQIAQSYEETRRQQGVPMANKLLFHVPKGQSPRNGEPPAIDGNTPNRYHSYFENAQGEQLICVYDRKTNTGILV